MWWHLLIGVLAGLAVMYLAMLLVLWRAHRHDPEAIRLRQALRMLPDLLRLLKGLAQDSDLPRGVRVRLVLLLVYLASPIDLIPDFIPVIGYADDVLVVALTLRSVVRAAGPEALEQHWPGTQEGLSTVRRLAGIR